MAVSWLQRACLLMALLVLVGGEPQTLCGAELVDAIQFHCDSGGMYYSKRTRSRTHNERTLRKNLIQACCNIECTLEMLDLICYPEKAQQLQPKQPKQPVQPEEQEQSQPVQPEQLQQSQLEQPVQPVQLEQPVQPVQQSSQCSQCSRAVQPVQPAAAAVTAREPGNSMLERS
ncbi:insulin-like growth factor I [Boleophthalmus pectinirostris]|uniref:insulin-like growth factor I n=1 Tax=Boleophthalmus pectinirostris TaxID=150288 RepID=UPI0024324F88|nr:insulin-like growth factor I [Boleophthalmus pectinirostris]